MKYGVAIFSVFLCVAAFGGGAGEAVRSQVAAQGLKIGHDRTSGVYVFVGEDEIPMGRPAASRAFLMHREKAFRVAELKAKEAILRAVSQEISASEEVGAQENGETAARTGVSVFKSFAENTLPLCRIMAAAEDYSDGLYSAAVAVVWEGRFAGAGDLPPLPEAECEGLVAWLGRQDLPVWTGSRLYVDSRGRPHALGIGVSRADAPRALADLSARKNLLFALYGDAEVSRAAQSAIASGGSAHTAAWDSAAAYSSLSSITVKDRVVHGMRQVAEFTIRHPMTAQDLRLAVYAVVGDGGELPLHEATVRAAGANVKIWNPTTRKYEEEKR